MPNLHLSIAADGEPADIEVRLIDEKDFTSALRAAFGAKITKTFVARTDPQCMTSVKSSADGEIVHAVSFIIVDKGDDVFLDCAYHELLHAFGLSNHDQHNPWTTLNQRRMVGYLGLRPRAADIALRPAHPARHDRRAGARRAAAADRGPRPRHPASQAPDKTVITDLKCPALRRLPVGTAIMPLNFWPACRYASKSARAGSQPGGFSSSVRDPKAAADFVKATFD